MVDQTLMDRNIHIMKTQDNFDNVSDGDHTFKELYYHRMVLFAALVNIYSANSWKSKQHSDGSMYDGYFIVGISTPEGQATYHYQMEYWDKFKCKELERAPLWDGSSPADCIERISRSYT
jgi:hypothetical protein